MMSGSVHFPPFHLPSHVDVLYCDSAAVALEPQAVRVLRYLIKQRQHVVSKEELLEKLWPDTFTTDDVLKKAVSQARRALGDDASAPRFIRTLHGRGYQFIGELEQTAATPITPLAQPANVAIYHDPDYDQLFGRAAEWQMLCAEYRNALNGAGRPVLIVGEPGIGKTQLARHFSGLAGQKLSFRLSSNAFDGWLDLLSPGRRVLLAEDDDSGGGTNAQILNFVLPTDGSYLIEASTAIAGQTGDFTLTIQQECNFSMNSNSLKVAASAGGGSFELQNTTNCSWTATDDAAWLSLSKISGSGGATVNYTVQANTTSLPREAHIQIGEQNLTIQQQGICTTTPLNIGQTLNRLLSPTDCLSVFTPTANAPYADLYSFTGGKGLKFFASVQTTAFAPTLRLLDGSGQLLLTGGTTPQSAFLPATAYTLPADGTYLLEVSSTTRAEGSYAITLTSNCSYTMPEAFNVGSAGATLNITVTTSTGCPWNVVNYTNWIKINSPTAATSGSSGVNLTASPNVSVARTAQLNIADKLVTLTQASGCTYSLAPASKNIPSGGGSGTITVTASDGECPWGVAVNAPSGMLIFGNPSSPKGNGTVEYFVNANAGAARSATFTVAGQTHTINQAAVAPNPAPTMTSFAPTYVLAGGATFKLKISGTNFLPGSVVKLNGTNFDARFYNDTQLEIEIPALAIKNTGELSVVVSNPTPGGGTTPERKLPIYGPLANVSAASYAALVSPDSIVAVFGNKLARAVETGRTIPLPTNLQGTTVMLRDRAGKEIFAPLFFVSPAQINYLFPSGLAAGPIQVTITSGNGEISVGELTLTALAPALFTANASGKDAPAALVLRVLADGRQVYENIATFDTRLNQWVPTDINLDNPREQVFLILFGSGLRGNTGLRNVSATLGRAHYAVGYAGAQGSLVGLDQVNLLLPNALAGSGDLLLSLNVDGKATNVVRIAVK